MYVKTKYDVPIDDNYFIPCGVKLKLIDESSEYKGFVAVEYKSLELYINKLYFCEFPVLI